MIVPHQWRRNVVSYSTAMNSRCVSSGTHGTHDFFRMSIYLLKKIYVYAKARTNSQVLLRILETST